MKFDFSYGEPHFVWAFSPPPFPPGDIPRGGDTRYAMRDGEG